MRAIESGEESYEFVEIMCCPVDAWRWAADTAASVRNKLDLRALRASVLYKADSEMDLRRSHENSAVKRVLTSISVSRAVNERMKFCIHSTLSAVFIKLHCNIAPHKLIAEQYCVIIYMAPDAGFTGTTARRNEGTVYDGTG